jgi:hypothetical protein
VAHRAAHRIDCFPGHEALEPRDLAASLFIGKPEPDQREAEDPVAFYEKFRTLFPGIRKADAMVRDMREKSGTCEFANRFCDGGRVNMKPGCDITGLYRASPFEDVLEVPDFFWRHFETVTVLHNPEYAGNPEKNFGMAPKLFTIRLWRNPQQYPEQGMDITLKMVQAIIVILISLTDSRYVRKGAGNPVPGA